MPDSADMTIQSLPLPHFAKCCSLLAVLKKGCDRTELREPSCWIERQQGRG
ncbi:MAG: hypothetical protein WBL40_10640 [Terrimicrobiaceae bacterium]